MYTVKEAAKLTGISEYTIRYYTNRDMVPMLQRDEKNNRMFNEASIRWLKGIKCFRDIGMPIEQIKDFCSISQQGEDALAKQRKIMAEQRLIAEEQLVEAKKRLEYIIELEQLILDHAIMDIV